LAIRSSISCCWITFRHRERTSSRLRTAAEAQEGEEGLVGVELEEDHEEREVGEE
jgi:hypothetical protein